MPFIEFDQQYRLGHGEIDGQHEGLFAAVNTLHEAMRAGRGRHEIGETLAFLRRYTVEHFQAEEGLMAQARYPGFEAHKRLHDELTRQVLDLEDKHRSGAMTLSLSVMNFLRGWLAQHISVEDRKVVAHLKAQGG